MLGAQHPLTLLEPTYIQRSSDTHAEEVQTTRTFIFRFVPSNLTILLLLAFRSAKQTSEVM